jgi:hemin uptake protein HemP
MSSSQDAFAERSKTDWKPEDGRTEPRHVQSRDLFAGRTEICIEHEGSVYRLKITRQGKLILNK